MEPEDAISLPVDGELDLHTFRPRDIKELIPDYLEACQVKGLLQVRLIHGKGTGQLREGVHRLLEKLPMVASFDLAPSWHGGWGATLVQLKAQDARRQEGQLEADM